MYCNAAMVITKGQRKERPPYIKLETGDDTIFVEVFEIGDTMYSVKESADSIRAQLHYMVDNICDIAVKTYEEDGDE